MGIRQGLVIFGLIAIAGAIGYQLVKSQERITPIGTDSALLAPTQMSKFTPVQSASPGDKPQQNEQAMLCHQTVIRVSVLWCEYYVSYNLGEPWRDRDLFLARTAAAGVKDWCPDALKFAERNGMRMASETDAKMPSTTDVTCV